MSMTLARVRSCSAAALAMMVLSCSLATTAATAPAKGTITFKSKSGPIVVDIKHAFLVKGPDPVGGKPIRRLVLSVEDVEPALRKCSNMSCSDGGIGEGVTVDFDGGPRVNYWFTARGQMTQYSGTADPKSVTLSTNTPDRLAGLWQLDDSAAGGPIIRVEFDVSLLKELKK